MNSPVRIIREIDLGLPADELWSLVADGDRWSEWLVDDAAVGVRPGSDGTVVDDGERRHVHVHTVRHGERVAFDWWRDDAVGGPTTVDGGERSRVEFEIVRDGERTALRVTETLVEATDLAAARASARWDVRLLVMHLAGAALART